MVKMKYGITGTGMGKPIKMDIAMEHPLPTKVNPKKWNPKEKKGHSPFEIKSNHFYMLTLKKGMWDAVKTMRNIDGQCSFSFEIPKNTNINSSYFKFGIIKGDYSYFGIKEPHVQIANGVCTFGFSGYYKINQMDPNWQKKYEEVFCCDLQIGELGLFDRVSKTPI